MNSYKHLDEEVIQVLSWDTEDRVEFSQRDSWIGYTRAHQVLKELDDLLVFPRSLRMPNILLVGESGNGKSTIIERFRELNPVKVLPSGDPLAPVLVMNMPSEPSESRFWTELLLSLKISHRDSDTVQNKEKQAVSVLLYAQVKLLVIDEIHNLLYGNVRKQRHFLAVIKNLSNKLKMPIVGVGTREAITALHTDPQLSSRFEALGLPHWDLNEEFLRLLKSFEKRLPLAEPSELTGRQMAILIHSLSGGTIGGISKILKKATKLAIRGRKERITLDVLKEVGWVKLSEYGKSTEACT